MAQKPPARVPARQRPEPAVRPPRLPALDGIRALAVLAVALYHFGVGWATGGFLGVDVFFVLSGYLITGQLVTRWVVGDRRSFSAFWSARARRLLPALALMLAGATVAMVALGRDQLDEFRGDLGAAATYTSNWWYVFHHRSYFESTGRPPVLQHLWSLAVEEQFYLAWPLLFAAVVAIFAAKRTRHRVLLGVVGVLATASALWMGLGSAAAQVPDAADPSRWYFGTDSHSMGLLIGGLLALVRHGDGLGGRTAVPHARLRWWQSGLGAVALAALLEALWRTDAYSAALYRWGFTAVSLVTAVVIAAATRPGPLAALLSLRPLRWLGIRSYAIYLWHWPIACFTRPGIDLDWRWWQVLALRVALTVLLAEASYWLVERPVRRQGWLVTWRRLSVLHVGGVSARAALGTTAFVVLTAAVVAPASAVRSEVPSSYPVVSVGRVSTTPPAPQPAYQHAGAPPSWRVAGSGATTSHRTRPAATWRTTPTQRVTESPTAKPSPPPAKASPTLPTPTGPVRSERQLTLSVYGDSVALGAVPALTSRFGAVVDHAQIGEQAWQLLPSLTAAARAGRLDGQVVLLHTGDNGVIPEDELRSALGALGGARRVIVVQPLVPREWEQHNRALLAAVVPAYRNARILDWYADASGHPSYFYSDGIHLAPLGQQVYAGLVAQAALAP
ncbi:MAG TPA: acyltransferase family protein [Nocardioidaceae bacterium]|nr:acyltransferase family protein [Nocardioidaceae bacterium]